MDNIKVGEKLEYCGLTYKAREVDINITHPYDKCELCDLKDGKRKLCLNNFCKCGSCFGRERKDGKDIIFIREDKHKRMIDKFLSIQKEIAQVENLKAENEILKEHNHHLAESNRRLMEQNKNFEQQLKNIYVNINKAIKNEVYKFMTKQ